MIMPSVPIARELTWLLEGDVSVTLTRLARELEAGRLDAIDRIRAKWWLRRAARAYGSGEEINHLLDVIDPYGLIPEAPDVAQLRFWIEAHARNLPFGALGRLARQAGLHRSDVGRFRSGGSLSTEKIVRLSAALISAGLMKSGGSR